MLHKIKLDRFNLRSKLVLAFVLVALVVVLTGAVGYTALTVVDDEAHHIAEDGEKMDAAAQVALSVERQQNAVYTTQVGDSGGQQAFEQAAGQFDERISELEALPLTSEQEARVASLRTTHEEYQSLGEDFFAAERSEQRSADPETTAEMAALRTEMEDTAASLEHSAQDEMAETVAVADETTQNAQTLLLGLTVGAFVLAIGIGLFVARRITPTIEQLSDAAVAISDGDLDIELDDHAEADEIGRMVDAFKSMQRNLRAVMAELGTVSTNLQSGQLAQDIDTDYPGTYGEVMTNLDSGTSQLTASFDTIRTVSDDLRTGTLDRTIDVDRPGQYGAVLEDLTEGTTQLEESFEQISAASDGLEQGDFEQTVRTDYPGTYGDVLESLDAGTTRLSESFTQISTVSEALEQGRLNHPVETDYPGSYGAVLEDLESSLDQLVESI